MNTDNFTDNSWLSIQLVCFDVDGTLYNQRKLRLFMIREMLIELSLTQKVTFIRILKIYRHLRETTVGGQDNFEQALISETADLVGCSEKQVKDTVIEWLHERPLRYLGRCRYAGVLELFSRLKTSGKKIGIFSDYPAEAKIAALGLMADYIAYAGDHDTPRLKPDPQGLLNLMARSGACPMSTLLIGDRPDRDGLAARRAGSYVLIRSSKKDNDYQTFQKYTDPLFLLNT